MWLYSVTQGFTNEQCTRAPARGPVPASVAMVRALQPWHKQLWDGFLPGPMPCQMTKHHVMSESFSAAIEAALLQPTTSTGKGPNLGLWGMVQQGAAAVAAASRRRTCQLLHITHAPCLHDQALSDTIRQAVVVLLGNTNGFRLGRRADVLGRGALAECVQPPGTGGVLP